MYREHRPCPALRDVVACYWTSRADASGGLHHRVLPDGCMDVLFDLAAPGGADRTEAVLVGTMTRALEVRRRGAVDIVAVRFAPGGAPCFLSTPPAEVVDRAPALEVLAVPGHAETAGRLAATTDLRARRGVLDRWLLGLRARRGHPPDPAARAFLAAARAARGRGGPGALMGRLELGRRQLERRVRGAVGVSPGTVCRVERMAWATALLAAGDGRSLTRIALEAGYADQAHMTREVRALVGTTPAAFRRERRLR